MTGVIPRAERPATRSGQRRRCSICANEYGPLGSRIVTDASGRVTATANLPFDAPLDDPAVHGLHRRLDRRSQPAVVDAGRRHGPLRPIPPSASCRARRAAGADIAVHGGGGRVAYRNARRAQRDRLWVAMAREAAHQMGTPLMSLRVDRTAAGAGHAARGLADHLEADAERLERVAQRFERIGNRPRASRGARRAGRAGGGYFRPRLPRAPT